MEVMRESGRGRVGEVRMESLYLHTPCSDHRISVMNRIPEENSLM